MKAPCLYLDYFRQTKDRGEMSQRTFEEADLHQFVTLVLPVLIGVARRSFCTRDFCDERPRYKQQNRSGIRDR